MEVEYNGTRQQPPAGSRDSRGSWQTAEADNLQRRKDTREREGGELGELGRARRGRRDGVGRRGEGRGGERRDQGLQLKN